MIILDTNVISEIMRDEPHRAVKTWFQTQRMDNLYTTSVSMAEVLYGLYRMPEGKRKETLLARFESMLNHALRNRVLMFKASHSSTYASIRADRDRIGKPMSNPDAQIASIAYDHQAQLATRNVKDFVDCGLDIVNPFQFED